MEGKRGQIRNSLARVCHAVVVDDPPRVLTHGFTSVRPLTLQQRHLQSPLSPCTPCPNHRHFQSQQPCSWTLCCGAGSPAFRQHDPGDGESGEAWKALNSFTRCSRVTSSHRGTQEFSSHLAHKMGPNKQHICCCKKTDQGRALGTLPTQFHALMSQSSTQVQLVDILLTVSI